MLRLFLGLLVLPLIEGGPAAATPARMAWPHRAILTSHDGRPAAFRAYTLGGVLIIEVDSAGRFTTVSAAVPRVRELAANDTIQADTPADFPLDLSKGPVVFVAEGRDSLKIVVRSSPIWGTTIDYVRPFRSNDPVRATGRMFTVRLVAGKFVIDKQ